MRMKKNKKSSFNVNLLIATVFGIGRLPSYVSYLLSSLVALPIAFVLFRLSTYIAAYFLDQVIYMHYTMISLALLAVVGFIAVDVSYAHSKQINAEDPAE